MSHDSNLLVLKSKTEKIHDWVCCFLIVGMLAYTVFSLFQMPAMILIQDNVKSSKWAIMIVPVVTIILYTLIIYVERHPIKSDNSTQRFVVGKAYAFYRNSKMLGSWIKLEMIMIFSYVNWGFIQKARSKPVPQTWYILLGFLIVILTVAIFSIRMSRIKSEG